MAANSKVSPLFSTWSFLIFFQLFLVSVIEANNNGFTIDLIHRDSPLSPYYNPSISQMERLNKACHRSYERAALFKPTSESSGTIQSPIRRIEGAYLMKVSIGTPPVEMLSIADTGSDLAWVQCNPCTRCYKQIAPLFNPRSSSTYKNMPCQSQYCKAVGRSSCASDNTCRYMVSYGDHKSYTIGDLAVETFTFGSTSGQSVSIPQIVFGCGHQNNGNFRESTSGIVGLGGGTLSIVNQLNKYIDGKFSYCLVPFGASSDVTSKLNFGSNAVVSGPQVVSTPLVQKAPNTYYYLTLEGVSVGNNKLAYESTLSNSKASTVATGNIIIDSGTTLTLLPRKFYYNLESTLEKSISGERTSASNKVFSLCYQSDSNISFPKITFHFTDADLEPSSTFVEVEAGVICLTMVPVDELAIFGNLSQMDFLVGYDLVNKKVSFLPTDCTKQS